MRSFIKDQIIIVSCETCFSGDRFEVLLFKFAYTISLFQIMGYEINNCVDWSLFLLMVYVVKRVENTPLLTTLDLYSHFIFSGSNQPQNENKSDSSDDSGVGKYLCMQIFIVELFDFLSNIAHLKCYKLYTPIHLLGVNICVLLCIFIQSRKIRVHVMYFQNEYIIFCKVVMNTIHNKNNE